MKKLLFVLLLALCSYQSEAYHIVGGEIEFITIEPGRYRLNLIQYRDEAQEDNPFVEDTIYLYMFSNKDDRFIRTFLLPQVDSVRVEYTSEVCQIDELLTSKAVWSRTFNLNPAEFADDEGYYIAWERCCRNNAVINVHNSVEAGMKYYVEIPPLSKNGTPYINSSPVLNKPLGDYACVGQLFYADFSGVDLDGDSLAYKLAIPLNSSEFDALPIVKPKPHIPVQWTDGYSLENTIPGNPALNITPEGLLTVLPEEPGLYVFSVIVEEWRRSPGGVSMKLGEVQRDFQMLVIDGCQPPEAPTIIATVPDQPDFDPITDTLFVTQDNLCAVQIIVTTFTGFIVYAETPDYDDYDFGGVLHQGSHGSGIPGGTGYCFPGCPPNKGEPFIVDFIVADETCPLPQLDTARILVQIDPPPNEIPVFNSLPTFITLSEGENYSFEFTISDPDLDTLTFDYFIDGDTVSLEDRGIRIVIEENDPGLIKGRFTWETDCGLFNFQDRQDFELTLYVEDQDSCLAVNDSDLFIDLNVMLPFNTDPVLTTTLPGLDISASLDELIEFEVTATDEDNDSVELTMETTGFDSEGLGISFVSQAGSGSASGSFQWLPACQDINIFSDDIYLFHFIAEDIDTCQVYSADTLTVRINLEPLQNERPNIELSQRNYTLEVNTPFELPISVVDPDGDSVSLQFFDTLSLPGDRSKIQFEPVNGAGNVSTTFSWTPDCDLLRPWDENGSDYEIIFLARDNSCPIAGQDTIKLIFTIIEPVDPFSRFDPPNSFSPNNDGFNDTFTLTGNADHKRNLPVDTCDDLFESIVIVNRNGRVVFESKDRNFSWSGSAIQPGTYFFHISYSRTGYKGFLQVLK